MRSFPPIGGMPGASAAQAVEVNIDPNTGRARIFVEKEVVEDVENARIPK